MIILRTLAVATLSLTALITLSAAKPASKTHAAVATPAAQPAPSGHADHGTHTPHWGYAGLEAPVHWGHLAPEFGQCATGQAQSPIDLGLANVQASVPVATDYRRGPLRLLNNGHTVQVNFDEGSRMTSSGRSYRLVQVHFHTPSENQLNGRTYPLEAHFVHADEDGRLAVLGVFFEEGATNVELAKVIVAAPRMKAGPREVEGFSFDPRALLPSTLNVYRFMGSLTTPPCTEGVHWHVARETVTASATQIAALAQIMGDNARPVQPLNNRLVIAPQ